MRIEKDFEEFIILLNEHSVRYLIVGAYAVVLYSIPRNTQDIDIFLEPTRENGEKIIQVLNDFGFGSLGFKIEDFQDTNLVIQLGVPPVRIDLMMSISGVDFESAWLKRTSSKFGNTEAWFISLEDLLINKKSSGRPKDLFDTSTLEKFDKRN